MKLTIFRNIFDIQTPFYGDINTVIDRIKNGHSQITVEEIRNAKTKADKNNLKKNLPSILFSGDFLNRKKEALPNKHSGLIVIDIDEVSDVQKVKKQLCADKYTLLCFVSPSGQGVKVVVKIPPDIKRHGAYFLGLEDYYSQQGIKIDKSGKNINRVCYESYDPDIYVNYDSEVFTKYIEEIKEARPIAKSIVIPASEDVVIQNIAKWAENNFNFYDGRNNYVHKLAGALNRYGVSLTSALSFCRQYEDNSKPGDPFTAKEIETTVQNVYKSYASEHGSQVFEDTEKRERIIDTVMAAEIEMAASVMSEMPEFEGYLPVELEEMAEEIKTDKKRSKKQTSSRVFWFYGDSGGLKIDTETMLQFINEQGFWVYYRSPNPDDYFFVHVHENIVSPVDTRTIKMSVLNYVSDLKNNAVYNVLNEKQKYFSDSFLNGLPVIKPTFLRDTETTAFIPTPEAVFKITKSGVKKIKYVDLVEGYVWKTQITKRNFEYTKCPESFDFNKFINLIGGEHHQSLRSYIGYLMHTYKDPTNAKAVFIYDTNLTQFDGEPEGGSGKSLLIEALKHIREVAGAIPADRIDFRRAFVMQEINESSQVAWFDELPKGFDVSQFFSRITGGIPMEKKGKDVILLEADKAPKMAFTSNYKPKGSSGSHVRRRLDFGVTGYFNAKHTPKKEFGRAFFIGWNEAEWNYFFSMYVDCLVLYLDQGAISYKNHEETYLTIVAETSPDFAEYWILEGWIEKALIDGYFNGREHYIRIQEQKLIDYNVFSLKKYYIYLKKVFDILNLSYKFEGKGEEKNVFVWKN